MAESDLLVLFGRESLDLVPMAWKELHEKCPTSGALEMFLSTYADQPSQYRPAKWYRYLPKTGDYLFRDIDADSVEQWIWYFPGDGFTDSQLETILTMVQKWAVWQWVASITLTFPPVAGGARKPQWWRFGMGRRMKSLREFMRDTEANSAVLVGLVTKMAEVKNGR